VTPQAAGAATLAARMREQAGWCARLGSPLYARLCEAIARDVEAGGPAAAVLAGHEADAPGSALALRLMGGVHRLVLDGRAPELAAHYPSTGARPPASADPWPAFRAVLDAERDAVRALLERPVQTNEVGRSAALLGGFAVVARETGLPLALLELGASAGLNLRWDRYRYTGGVAWGDPASAVQIPCEFTGAPPALPDRIPVVARAGCDRRPIDPTTADGARTLEAYLWPDQLERLALLRAAITVARRVPACVDEADAPAWLAARLAERPADAATVVVHSIFWQYLDEAARDAIRDAIAAVGRGTGAPLAWLRLEPAAADGPFEVRLTTWPGGRDRRLAEASPHGRRVHWLGGGDD